MEGNGSIWKKCYTLLNYIIHALGKDVPVQRQDQSYIKFVLTAMTSDAYRPR